MTTFVRYDNEVRVAEDFSPYFEFNTHDLAPYLNDTSAVGVLLRVLSTGSTQVNVQVTEVGTSSVSPKILSEVSYEVAVSLAGGTSIDVRFPNANVDLYIVGEIHADLGAVLHDARIELIHVADGHDVWVDRQVTPESGDDIADIAAVIVRSIAIDINTQGIREKGSTDSEHLVNWEGGGLWHVIGLDQDGKYQTRAGGKAGNDTHFTFFYEIGYVKKNSGLVTIKNPVDEGVSVQQPGFGTLDLSGVVPAQGETAGVKFLEDEGGASNNTYDAYVRNTGSTDSIDVRIKVLGQRTQMIKLNESRRAEYILEKAGTDLYVTWYEALAALVPVITNTPPTSGPIGVVYTVQMASSGISLTWSLSRGPDNATIDSSTGLISWIPPESSLDETIKFTVKVTNPAGSDTLSWEVFVTPPQLIGTPVAEPALTAHTKIGPVLKAKTQATIQ